MTGPMDRFPYGGFPYGAFPPDPPGQGPSAGDPPAPRPAGPPGSGRTTLPPELDPRGPGGPRRPGPGRGPGEEPKPARPRRSRRRRILTWLAAGTAAIVLLGAATGWALFEHLLNGIHRIGVFCSHCDRPSGGVQGDLNILIVGSDSRAGLTNAQKKDLHVGHDFGRRSDTMILLHIPRGGGKAVLVSLPRDSLVTIPAHKDASGHRVPATQNKLNTAYSFGGPKLTIRTVERNTGVRIDHYVEVNFLGFVNIVNALGGVDVCTPTPIHDPVHRLPTGGYGGSGLELPAGTSHLNGTRALEYVRAREFDPSADLGRIQRQQKFMAAMVQRAKSIGVLLNPVRLFDFIGAVGKSLTTDKDFGTKQIKDLALNLRSMSPAHVEMIRVPLEPGSFNTNVGNVVKWDPTLAPRLFHDLTEDKPVSPADRGAAAKVTIAPSNISLDVRNSTNQNGFAAAAANDLARLGFRIANTGNSPKGADPAHTIVRYGPARADSAKTVAAAIPGAQLKLDQSFGSNLQVQLGSDYHGVRRVTVVAAGQSGTLTNPRTAAQDICS
ncbi:MAG TPA: LCP family protein [Mycobacteriales bacterium]|nr:LCP family protein [Mycobacteriales bacterium]